MICYTITSEGEGPLRYPEGSTAMTTTNEMIFATLKTKSDKTPKFAEQLRALGYEVTNTETCGDREIERERWAVNNLEITNPCDGNPLFISLGGGNYVDKLDNIKKVDFVNYFATKAERTERRKLRSVRGNIWQEVRRYGRQTKRYCINPEASWRDREYREFTFKANDYYGKNETVAEYIRLRDKADATVLDRKGAEIKWAIDDVKRAEEKVQKALEELKRAQERLAEKKARQAEGNAELNAFLKAKGIR